MTSGDRILSRNVVLVHPPQAKACEPAPGILALAGHLERSGVPVSVVDANLRVQEAALSSDSLLTCARALQENGAPRRHVTSALRCARQAPEALSSLRHSSIYREPVAYRAAVDDLEEAYRAVSRATRVHLSLSDLRHPRLSPLSSRDLASAAADPFLLPVGCELARSAEEILAHDPAVVGVSITYLSQALASFALAGLLRRSGYRGALVLGGGVITSWAPRLRPSSDVFRVWDAVVVGPGERPIEALAADRTVSSLPGVLAPSLGVWNPLSPGTRPDVCFDFALAGLPWGRYLAPGPVLPVATSRGCYWRRCAFCPEAAQDRQPFRRASPRVLARSILEARDKQGVSWVHLTDDAVPPAALRALARELRGRGVSWYGFVRLERALLDPGFATELAEGGCAMLQLGVETASQRLLDLMGKGTRAENAGPIIVNLARAGIRTYVYLLFGLPSETLEEAQGTIDWACAHAGSLTFLNLALMNHPRELPTESGGGGHPRAPDLDLALDLSLYQVEDVTVARVRRRARSVLSQARAHPVLRAILQRTPPGFTSNHAAFAPLAA